MDIEEIKKKYEENITLYNNLGKNVIESLRILLEKADVKFLSIYFRVKETASFIEKIERKSYENPLEEIEDICGIRIICYYQKDIVKIIEIIKKEFSIFESQNKETNLEYNQFGYRSHHVIASIKQEWEKAPNFRGLSHLKCEIQVRTILMHAWAEIEHSLAYKTEAQTPTQFRRKLHRISAKLEEADEQFEELKKESESYQNQLIKESKKEIDFEEIELNLDSLQAFMDTNFPKRKKNIEQTGRLLDQMIEYKIDLKKLAEGWKKIKPHFNDIEKEYWKNYPTSYATKWVQAGIARITLDMNYEQFRNRFKSQKYRDQVTSLNKKFLKQ